MKATEWLGGSPAGCSGQPRLVQSQELGFLLPPDMGAGAQALGLSSAAFPATCSRKLEGGGAARGTQAGVSICYVCAVGTMPQCWVMKKIFYM